MMFAQRDRARSSLTQPALAVLSVCLIVGGCATTAPTADPSASAGTSRTPGPPAPAAAADINGKLLAPGELADIVGGTDMTPGDEIREPKIEPAGFDPLDCVAVGMVGATFSYWAPGRTAMAGDRNSGAPERTADQVISEWQDAMEADTVVDQSAYEWQYCPFTKPFSWIPTGGGTPAHWRPYTDHKDQHRIGLSIQRSEPPQQSCYHVMADQGNIVVEVLACGDGDTASQANEIANRILAKFSQ